METFFEVNARLMASAINNHEASGRSTTGGSVSVTARRVGAPYLQENREQLKLAERSTIWWRRPKLWRDDINYESNGNIVNVVRTDESSCYVSSLSKRFVRRYSPAAARAHHGSVKRKAEYYPGNLEDRLRSLPVLLHPLATGWDFSIGGVRTLARHVGIEVVATWVAESSSPTIWPFIREFAMVVHEDSGVVLQYAGLVDGVTAAVFTTQRIAFDVAIEDEVFAPEVPPQTQTELVENEES